MRKIEADLAELGFPIVGLSPDRPEKIRQSVIETDLSYRLFSDSTLTAAKAFGIVWQANEDLVRKYKKYGLDIEEASGLDHHQLPVPSVFLVEKGGVIRWMYSNPDHRVRPDNELLMEAARKLAS